MASMAKVQIIGNVGRDPEQRYTQQGTMVVSFSVAVNNRRRNPDGSFNEETEWYRVNTFGRLAETCQQYVTKGSSIFIDGRLRVDRWTGQDGQPRYTLDVVANDVQFIGSRQREGIDGDQPTPIRNRPAGGPELDQSDLEDLPF
jgi:single-strand DNA-binding protein